MKLFMESNTNLVYLVLKLWWFLIEHSADIIVKSLKFESEDTGWTVMMHYVDVGGGEDEDTLV